MKKTPLIFLLALVVVGAVTYCALRVSRPSATVANFLNCAEAGYPIMESYPRQCKTPDGKTFREDIGNELAKDDLIRVANPRPNQKISSPLVVKGVARGSWFFEASFPIRLEDSASNVIARGVARALGEWMTNDFVPFSATLLFTAPNFPSGKLILEKDNPSGLSQYDDAIVIPVAFKKSAPVEILKPCKPSGCSGEICSDEDIVSICIYRSEFACYKTARCERQAMGKCGWTQTSQLEKCLEEKKSNNADTPQ